MGFLWLRDETRPFERRTPLLPKQAELLIKMGHTVKVERSNLRIIPDSEYEKVGCSIVPSGSWEDAEDMYYILGIKDLPKSNSPIRHTHIYYAHCYKGQKEGKEILSRFKKGKGVLLDAEYLTEESGKPLTVGPAGYLSGYTGAAMGIQLYLQKKLEQPLKLSAPYFQSKKDLLSHTVEKLKSESSSPSIVVIGSKGNSGQGATEFLKGLNITPTLWGRNETSDPQILSKLNQFEIVLNCIYSDRPGNPFLVETDLYLEKKLSILVDVTCDVGGTAHRFPFYSQTTTFETPCLEVGPKENPVHVIGIDHLTNWIPLEASQALADPLFPLLQNLLNSDKQFTAPWEKTKNLFLEKIHEF